MGVVYKARDTRLDRTVAIKVLPPQTSDRTEVRQRFEREARAVSALNHPHICTLYDVGHEGAVDYLVMEFVEGETLADRLKRGALSLDQALRTATEIADALDRAHRTGIVHRDLKPGNIMLTKDGAKVLDFGLAKMHALSAGTAVSGGSVMQTLTSPLTGEGAIVGTLQYMSPEQLEGREADARSDIFSFGAVLYEMAAGRKPFEARTQAGLIAQIMQSEPPGLSSVLPQAPAALEQLARACLAKDPAERRQTMRDVLTDLKWIAASSSRPDLARPVVPRRRVPVWIWQAAAAFTTAVALALAAAWWLRPRPETPVSRFAILAPEKATFGFGLALSPDGRRLAFAATAEGGQDLLWIRPLDSLAPRAIPGTDGAQLPFWSPDGRSVAFFAQGKLKRVDISGGPVQNICDAPDPRGGAWGPDGTILVAPEASLPLQRVPATGGTPVSLTKLDPSRLETSHRWPKFLPDGRHYICFTNSSKPSNLAIAVGSLDSPELRILTRADSAPGYSPPGFLLFARGTTLMAQSFNPSSFRLSGDPIPVASDMHIVGISTGPTGAAQFTVSANGTLVYQTGGEQPEQLAWFDRSGKSLGLVGPPGAVNSPDLSPDGRRAVIDGVADLWLFDTDRGSSTRFTFAAVGDNSGVWSPDGSRIVFSANRNGRSELYLRSTSGAAVDQPLLRTDADLNPDDWSRDGRFIFYESFTTNTRIDLWYLPVDGDRKPVPYLQTEFNEAHARLSPDGKWLAYASDETGRPEIYVQSFPTPGAGKFLISTGGGDQPAWRRDGKELYYLTQDRKLMSVDVKTVPSFEASPPKLLFRAHVPVMAITTFRNHYAVSADGQKFLITTIPEAESAAPLVVVLNWLPH
jgi:Tol biopolymer transport system component/tRNA A-37 threonylcarbamoyl transferase component Bud32